MLLKIYRENPNPRDIGKVVSILQRGGCIIYPTDTVYGLACDIIQPKAVEKIALIKGLDLKNAFFSLVCHDLSLLSDYAHHVNNTVFKLMKKNLPGPFTFILPAVGNIPKLLRTRKKTVGIRIPDCNIAREIVRQLGNPIMSTSIHDDDEIVEYTTDPELIHEKYRNSVDIVINGGYGGNMASTVVDCTGDEIEIVREGKGELVF